MTMWWHHKMWFLGTLLVLLAGQLPSAAAQEDVQFVKTEAEFQTAIAAGVRHIILRSHMDLRQLSSDPTSPTNSTFVVYSQTQSIRGDCAGSLQPANITLNPPVLYVGQCIIIVAAPFLELRNAATLLLSDVYILLQRPPPVGERSDLLPLISLSTGSLWMANTILRGDSNNCRGVWLNRSQRMHSRRCSFVGFSAANSAAVRCEAGSAAGFRDVVFTGNAATEHGSCVGLQSGKSGDTPAAAWFQSCSVSNNADPQDVHISQSDSRSGHYSNRDFQKSVDVSTGMLIIPDPIDPETLKRRGFLVADADGFQAISQEQEDLTNLAPVPIEGIEMDEGDVVDDSGLSTAAIGGIVAGILVAVLLVAVVTAVYIRRKRKQAKQADIKDDLYPNKGIASKPGLGISYGVPPNSSQPSLQPPQQPSSMTSAPSTASQDAYLVAGTGIPRAVYHGGLLDPNGLSDNDTSTFTNTSPGRYCAGGPVLIGGGGAKASPAAVAAGMDPSHGSVVSGSSWTGQSVTRGQVMDRDGLEEALDEICDHRILFLGRFELYSQVHRRIGGQGVVQFARGRYDDDEFAIKFFLNRVAFEREEALYVRADLCRMMPAVKDIVPNTDGAIRNAAGFVFPPCIVVEKGESLDEWALRIKPDFPTILTVLCHVLERLQQLHSCGIAHRDLKPGNVLWRPKHHAWTLIDYGCAAEIGMTCPLSFSLFYSPPESIQADENGQKTTVADPAADMWSLGVVAYELLTAKRAFPRTLNAQDVRAQITGRAPLPWESTDFRKKNVPELRMLQRTVLSCLARDPLKRPTSSALLQSWNSMFDSTMNGTITQEMGHKPNGSQ